MEGVVVVVAGKLFGAVDFVVKGVDKVAVEHFDVGVVE